jgi:trigger factor
MQITETTSQGLKRSYKLTIPAADIDARVSAELKRIAPTVRMPGFRPGKVPANLLRKMHGPQLHAQAVQETIRESVDTLMKDKALRPAMQPRVSLKDGYAEGKDAELTVDLEVLPEIAAPSLEGLKIERLVAPVTDAEVDAALARIAGQNKSYTDAKKGKKAENGDQLIIDFVGRTDGVEFEGGKAEGAALVLGSGMFIPGFEDQLLGVKAGDKRTITVTFPAEYQAKDLAGKQAEFDVTVQAVRVEGESKVDEDFAKSMGFEGLEKLRELVRGQLEQEHNGLTRTQMKRALLDQLAAGHDFDVPEQMVEAEFEQIWAQLEQEAARSDDPEAARREIEAEKEDYRRIAVRRVRLGLLLSEIGQANNVQVTQQEMSMLVQQAAQQYRQEDRERFVQFVQSEPMAAAQLRAPLYEDKVVDFLFSKAEITEREVTREELEAAIEADEDTSAKPAAAKGKPKKAASAKSGKSAPEKPAEAETKQPAAKKPAAKKSKPKAAGSADAEATGPAAEEGAAAPAPKAAAAKPASKKASARKA